MNSETNQKSSAIILLVEDEVNIAKLFSYTISKAGFECEVAGNGIAGLEAAKKLHPDLIISDIMMPEMDGFEFRKKLIEDPELKSIPFVFLTAKGTEDDILQGYDLGIEDYITKTASPKIVIAKISAILKSLEKERVKVVDEVQKAADSMGAKVVPDEFPNFDGFKIRHWHLPYKNVPGGDFIDYFPIDENNIAVVLGDVMGKRWGAWYFAVAYAGYVRSATRFVLEAATNFSPSDILHRVNDAIFKDERISQVFITLSIIIINKQTKIAKYSGAGDLPIIFKSKETKAYESKGLLLGFSGSGEYEDHEIQLISGDELFLATDGIIECRNSNGELYGHERFLNFIGGINTEEDSLEQLKSEIFQYTDGQLEDDLSVIAIKMI